MRVGRNEKSLRNAKIPLAWLYAVTHSVLVDHYRKQNRTPPQAMNDMIMEDLPAPAQSSETEFEKCLAPLLSSLPDKYRDAIEFVSPALASWFCGQASRAAKNKPASAWWPERV